MLSVVKLSYSIAYVSDNELRQFTTLVQVSYVSFISSSAGFGLEDSLYKIRYRTYGVEDAGY